MCIGLSTCGISVSMHVCTQSMCASIGTRMHVHTCVHEYVCMSICVHTCACGCTLKYDNCHKGWGTHIMLLAREFIPASMSVNPLRLHTKMCFLCVCFLKQSPGFP